MVKNQQQPISIDVSENGIANANRRRLRDAGVLAVSVVGGPGCGKTMLLDETVKRLILNLRVGVISADVQGRRPTEQLAHHAHRVVRAGAERGLSALDVRDALNRMDLDKIDILIIENAGTLIAPALDLGQQATVTIFSVAGGDDKAQKHPELAEAADVVILNKTDLLPIVPFDIAKFRADVRHINPRADLFEISALKGEGFEQWLAWLKRKTAGACMCKPRRMTSESHWFG